VILSIFLDKVHRLKLDFLVHEVTQIRYSEKKSEYIFLMLKESI